jgi:plasma-membrane proton-efflux P-type ATPase
MAQESSGDTTSRLLEATARQSLTELGSDLSTGLSQSEVEQRRARFGPNRIPEETPQWILSFLKKFWGLSAWMIELIVILSIVLHRSAELWVSAGLLVLNALISFFQDRRASRAVEVLKSRLQVNARVLRDHTWKVLPAQELVPGDIVRLRAGDFIPADAKIAEGNLGVDQSALTGESAESAKGIDALLYSGSVVKRGEATTVVILTGPRTYYGRTTELVQSARPRLHLEEVVSKIVRWLFVIVGVLVGLALGVSYLRGIPLVEILPLALVLLLSAVPVALPVMFTVSMAVGALELARKGVLITRLSAAEDAAGMDVLCIDKTGTITMNRLEVSGAVPLNGYSEVDVIRAGAWASQEANQDPIDLAFLSSARARGFTDTDVSQVSYVPFAPETKRTEAVVESRGKRVTVMKGALSSVAQACGLEVSEISWLESQASEHARKGYRVLAVATSSRADRLELAGLVTLSDPARPDSRDMIRAVRALGVSVKMLTGDALPVAQEIASSVGLGEIRRVGELHAAMSESPQSGSTLVDRCGGFAEVLPEDKFLVVKGLQSAKHVTGMTGDGVNDAPALRRAEVGVAVSTATDAAKASASVVLTAEGLSGIIDLIRNGRIIHQRILTWVVNKVSRTILKAVLVTGVFLATGKFVISALGMMLLVFMTDFVKITLATDRAEPSPRPDTWDLRGWVKLAAVLGILLILESLALLALGWHWFGLASQPEVLGTFTFFMFLSFAVCSIASIRERGPFWKSQPSRILLGALVLDEALGLGIAGLGVPGLPTIGLGRSLFVLAYALLFGLLLNDLVKVRLIRALKLA